MLVVVAVVVCCGVGQGFAQLPDLLYSNQGSRQVYFRELSKKLFRSDGVLPQDREVSDEVSVGNVSSFSYLQGTFGALTIIIRPCSASINITVSHIHQNNTGPLRSFVQQRTGAVVVAEGSGFQPFVFSRNDALPGLYLFDLEAQERDTMVTMYATSLPDVPPVLTIDQSPRVYIQRRMHRDRVTLRWTQSVIDPQLTDYCVVVNSRRNFTSLCQAAHTADMNVQATDLKIDGPQLASQKLGTDDVFITCVGPKLSYTISNLEKGREYYFNVFARNRYNRLSFLYTNKYFKYEPKVRPIGLRDNKPFTVNIQRNGGKAFFRYKVSKKQAGNSSSLIWHVMPCGGKVEVVVTVKRQVVVPRQSAEGYWHITILDPEPGMRYVLRVYATDPWQMKQINKVEVLVTMKPSPLPLLPIQTTVHEFTSMRTCSSVTVGWLSVTTQSVMYCVSATPVPAFHSHSDYYFQPKANQCNLDNRIRKQLDFARVSCQIYHANEDRKVLVETITKLRPGKEYLIQVIVKKIKGKSLSYDLLRVNTKSEC